MVQTDRNGVIDPKASDTNDTKVDTNDTIKESVLRIIRDDPKITQKDIGTRLDISIATVKRLMSSLQKSGKLQRKGSSRKGSWVIIN